MNKSIKTLIAALALFAGVPALAGDIYSIMPCKQDGTEISGQVASMANPLGGGEKIYFKLRFVGREPNKRWSLQHVGFGSELVDDAMNPLQLGIYVSGRLDYATLIKSNIAAGNNMTDFIFEYVTKPGDFALPILLATPNGPAGDKGAGGEYVLGNADLWSVQYNAGTEEVANWVDASWSIFTGTLSMPEPAGVTNSRKSDYSLSQCGFYVKTIDFSPDDESTEFWRTVHENSTVTGSGLTPKLVADAAPTEAVTLYVWSDNDEAVIIDGGETVRMQVDAAGTEANIQVGTITFAGGQASKDFDIRGVVGGYGKTANLVLSAYKGYNYRESDGTRIIDYVTAKVKCIEAMPPSVVIECDRTTAAANSDYISAAAVLHLSLSQPYDAGPVKIRITPEFTDASDADWKNYLRFSTSLNTIDEPSADNSDAVLPEVTISQGSTEKLPVYVFCLRSDTHTIGTAKIKFKTEIVDDPVADAVITEKGTRSINVTAETTAITAPAAGSKAISTTCNDVIPFTIAVKDTYADTHDLKTGYTIYFKYRSQDTFVKLEGTYYVNEGGALYKLDLTDPEHPVKTLEQPTVKYTASGLGLESQVYVVAPVNPNTATAKKSEIITFLADVKEARTVKAISLDKKTNEEKWIFEEGETAKFQVKLSEVNETGANIYAYLKPVDTVDIGIFGQKNQFIVGMPNLRGIPIAPGTDSGASEVQLLDGEAEPGLQVTFQVILSEKSNWDGADEALILNGYNSNYLTITVLNAEPTIKRVELNGNEADGDGFVFKNKLPIGQNQKFTVKVDDPGKFDLTTTDPDKLFQVKWSATIDGESYQDPVVVEGNPDNHPFEYAFPAAGMWEIVAKIKDKDMDDWSDITYTVYVEVLDKPAVEYGQEEMVLEEVISENAKSNQSITVGIGYWDTKWTASTAQLQLLLQVAEATPGRPNPGKLKLDDLCAIPKNQAKVLMDALTYEGAPTYDDRWDYYLVTLSKSQMRQKIPIREMDGTDDSSTYGFRVTGWIVSHDVLPTSGQDASTYYLTAQSMSVLINNTAPVIGPNMTPENSSSNVWNVAGGAASDYKIKWHIKSDVNADLKEKAWGPNGEKGLHVTVAGCQNANTLERWVTEPATEEFTPDFGSNQGPKTVTVTIEDKDGGTRIFHYYYNVEVSKFLETLAHGPSAGTSTSKLSQRYARQLHPQGGIGSGHTFVSRAIFSSAVNFQLSWNCGKDTSANAYAFGYRSGDKDNGLLNNKMDHAINTVGAATGDTIEGDFYEYTDPYDSFFYCWILTSFDENGVPTESILGESVAPEIPGKVAVARVPLPTAKTPEGNYVQTIAEAIFSREYLTSDNLGDINADGIPDHFAVMDFGNSNDEGLIGMATGKTIIEADTADISQYNGDHDYLPGVFQDDAFKDVPTLVDGAKASYAPIGLPFTAFMELRGFHEGLNMANDITTSDPFFSEDETNAYKVAWSAANDGAEWPDENPPAFDLNFWSPEPKGSKAMMDPTMEDTDGDTMPDGWEYFFWYQAHVWAPAKAKLGKPAKGQVSVFERFQPGVSTLIGAPIDPLEVEARFNPLEKLDISAKDYNPDFDGDGLSDLEELLIGTNPCHWDTDGDHMCDGWEVMMSLDPLAPSKDTNPDGDFMAYFSTFGITAYKVDSVNLLRLRDQAGNDKLGPAWLAAEAAMGYRNPMGYTPPADENATGYLFDLNDVIKANVNPVDPDYIRLLPGQTVSGTFLFVETFKGKEAEYPVDADGNRPEWFPYCYGLSTDLPDPVDDPDKVDPRMTTILGYYMSKPSRIRLLTLSFQNGDLAPSAELDEVLFVLVHDQIHQLFGFDPRTAWYEDEDGYVASRWNPLQNDALEPNDITGLAQNTRPYSTYDEYLLMRYRSDIHGTYPGEKELPDPTKDAWGYIRNLTTNPNVPIEETESTEDVINTSIDPVTGATNITHSTVVNVSTNETEAYRISQAVAEAFRKAGSKHTIELGHGADTDGDGAPDGWELYVNRNPNAGAGKEENPMFPYTGTMLEGDIDDDELLFAEEYAGTDSCDAYAKCPSIYLKHPGIEKGWYNKFFPTDPDNGDTDGDTIPDAWEGMAWDGTFPNGGVEYVFNDPPFTAIYGEPTDDGSVCIRGGGMNPLTIDTDLDALPDQWEMAFAGLAFDAGTKKYAGPAKDGDDIELAAATWIADRIFNGGKEGVIYLAGGLDPTWSGDAWTDPQEINSFDPLLGTTRDVDFDHDGLQNYQEYLVQTLRHLRYDDITTPLMGRILTEGVPAMGIPHTQEFLANIPMCQKASEFCRLALLGYGVPEATLNARIQGGRTWQYGWTAAGWRNLGYMALCDHPDWDRSITWKGGQEPYYYLFAPAGAGAYCCTDPRIYDSDGDQMDDYYEVFHGLNPLLGTADIIASAYGMPMTYNARWNEWTHPDFDRSMALFGFPGSAIPELSGPRLYDPVLYPWNMGVAEADADGDGIRNAQEAICANVASPVPRHTDPTPLWFTDSSNAKSYTAQYYPLTSPASMMPFWPEQPPAFSFPDGTGMAISGASVDGGTFSEDHYFDWAFEENEGYDTDNDFIPDGREIVKTTQTESDPLKFTDPSRRQAMWFDGVNSYLISRDRLKRTVAAADFMKQFTVECWVRPETRGAAQTIIERSSYYKADAVTKLDGVIRANFRLGLAADGSLYGLFDNDDAKESGVDLPESCQRVIGNILPTNEWTHVALTYDGHILSLYENGRVVTTAPTELIPATGVIAINQDPVDPGLFPFSGYVDQPTAFFVGARPKHFVGGATDEERLANIAKREIPLYAWYVDPVAGHLESFDNYREYFKGYVDEVRVWDGAQPAAQILANYKKRLSFDEVAANREEVYQLWANGATRNDNDGLEMLPPELVQHYSFAALPGAINPGDVATTPVGFEQNVQAAVELDYGDTVTYPDIQQQLYGEVGNLKGGAGGTLGGIGIKCGWWEACVVKSQVYTDTRIVPWVKNTVQHLPRLDGSSDDTFYYADTVGAVYQPAISNGVDQLVFPNTASPYSRYVYCLDNYLHLFNLNILQEQRGDTFIPLRTRYEYQVRSHFVGTTDLIPMGNAFAKTCEALWDNAPSDAWEYTGADTDADGLPDWWEGFAAANHAADAATLSWDTLIKYNGKVAMLAYQAYLIDLARGLQPDGTYAEDYAASVDDDNDGLPDWWENMFAVSEYGASDDPDHDGLSNYAEWRISFGPAPYGVDRGWPFLDPSLAHTDPQQKVTDYFLQPVEVADHAHEYLGEVVTDHDFMEDPDEAVNGTDRTKYDPNSDFDGDGWSAWSEVRYSNFKASILARLVSHFGGDSELTDSPMPALHATVRYNGTIVPQGAATPIVVAAYSGNNLQKQPTAKFVINPGQAVTKTCYLGSCEEAHVVHGTLAPGFVQGGLGNLEIQFSFIQPDDHFMWTVSANAEAETEDLVLHEGTWAQMYAAYQEAVIAGLSFRICSQSSTWTALEDDNGSALQLSVDESAQKGHLLFLNKRVGEIDLLTGDFDFDTTDFKDYVFEKSGVALNQCVARIQYQALVPTLQNKALTVSLTKPDEGFLKEGPTAFVAFFDLDGNGTFDPETEPVGIARDVDVGWDRVPELVIEMTDASTAGLRFNFAAEADIIRIIRTSVNGETEGVKRRIVYSRKASEVERKNIYDGDLVTSGKFGLDWSGLRSDLNAMEGLAAKDVKSVGYTIVSGAGSVLNLDPASILKEFTVEYTAEASAPTCVSPSPKSYYYVESSRPVFKWTAPDGYTAYRLQIADTNNVVVYSSELAALPPRNGSLQYELTPSIYVGTNVVGDAWVLDNDREYRWRVALYNAKFSDTNDAVSAWSDWTKFETRAAHANDATTSYGCADVTVGYFGPAENALKDVIVQLYKNADFAGKPVAQTRLYETNGTVRALTNLTAKVRFVGLESGDYYACAFIDRNGNFLRDRYEVWGYSCKVDHSQVDIYTPVEVAVDATGSAINAAEVFMEDTDVNQNDIYDCREDESLLADVAASASGADTTDVDGDGLTADEETSDTYTDSQKWDTDGDGVPDGWEAKFADTDPLDYDSDLVLAGDVMAYFEEPRFQVTDAAGNAYLLATNVIVKVSEDEWVTNTTARVGDAISYASLVSSFDYTVMRGKGANAVLTTVYGVGTNLVERTETFLVDSIKPVDSVLLHAQVYDRFGFNQKTAIPQSGSIHTKPFTALDKYLTVRYLTAIGFTNAVETVMNLKGTWKNFTLKPGDSDNDRDGIADGWELYVMFGTNTTAYAAGKALSEAPISPWNFNDRANALDDDTLSNVDEYSDGNDPSDPWDAYSVYKSLVAQGVISPDTAQFTDEVRRFGIGEDELNADWDLDLISNGQESWAYYLDYANIGDATAEPSSTLWDLDVRNAFSDGVTPDYFRTFVTATEPNETNYLGAVYNGAEFIEPAVRSRFEIEDLQRAGTRDLYASGWDVWSIVRSSLKTLEESGMAMQSEELNIAVKYTAMVYGSEGEGFTGGSEPALIEFHQKSCPVCSSGDETTVTVHSLADVIKAHGGLTRMKMEIRNRQATGFNVEGFEIPEPQINFTFKYAGQNQQNIVIEAYQVSSAYPEFGEQLTASWSAQPAFDAGIGYYRATTTGKGTLKQGKTRFIAYIDRDGDGVFSEADTFGTATVNVGFVGADVTIRLGDANPALPSFTIGDGSNVVSQLKIVRTHVNGKPLISPHTVYNRIFANNVERATVFPDDYVNSGTSIGLSPAITRTYIGVDPNLSNFIRERGLGVVDNVTYEILVGPGPFTVSNLTEFAEIVSNQVSVASGGTRWNFATNIVSGLGGNYRYTVDYSRKRDIANVTVLGDQLADGEAILSFTVPQDTPATKFWLKVNGVVYPNTATKVNGKTYTADSGFLIPNPADGVVTIRIEDYLNGVKLATTGDYRFQVGLGNDRFPKQPTAEEWSKEATVRFNAGKSFTGKFAVSVRHPLSTLEGLKLTVAAYETPDLVNPVKYVTGDATNEVFLLNGLREGRDYYLAAWCVKNSGDGRDSVADRMPYDTWGYLTSLGVATNGFDAAKAKATEALAVTNVIYLQDTDWNDNGISDRDENFKAVNGYFTPGGGTINYLDDFNLDGIPDQAQDSPVGPVGPEEPDDPVDPEDPDDPATKVSDDLMAYYEREGVQFVALGPDGETTNWVWVAILDPEKVSDAYRLTDGSIQLQTPANELDGAIWSTWDYYRSAEPRWAEMNKWCGIGTNVTYGAEWKVQATRIGKAKFVHAQVYSLFGFNPKTCVSGSDSVNTKDFTANDKYLVCRYLQNIGVAGVDETLMATNPVYQWIWTLPNKVIDSDRDGIADGWELYTMFGPTDGTLPMATIDDQELTNAVGQILSPFNTADGQAPAPGAESALKAIEEYDGGHFPTDPWALDTDDDGIADAVDYQYHLKGTDGSADADGDGLSNYTEYILTEVFDLRDADGNRVKFDPDNAMSVQDNVSDYFFRVGELYIGEIFTDHDMVEDLWEQRHLEKSNKVSPYLYDANADADDDGWSNYDEFQAETDPNRLASLGVDAVQMSEYPIPTVEIKLRYEGAQNTVGKGIVVKAWQDQSLTGVPDAVWTIGDEGTTTVLENGNSNTVNGVKYIGMNPHKEMLFHLSPGSIVAGSVKFELKDLNWILYNRLTGQAAVFDPETATWQAFINDRAYNDNPSRGEIYEKTTGTVLGEIDYVTGAVTLDFTKLPESVAVIGDISTGEGGDELRSIFDVGTCYFRATWYSKTITGGSVQTYYLSEADERSETNNSLGHLRPGLNTFVAFIDLDGNGRYTAGEPYGTVKDVEVGWNYAKLAIDLTDTNPIFARVCCGVAQTSGETGGSETGNDVIGLNDRDVLYGTASGNLPESAFTAGQPSGGISERIRVVRTFIDGLNCTKDLGIDDRVVLDKTLNLLNENYITEADILAAVGNEFDIDWEYLMSDYAKRGVHSINLPVTSVVYRIVMGNGDVTAWTTNNLVAVGITRVFDAEQAHADNLPVTLSSGEINSASPTFRWAIPHGLGTYTAFQLVIYDGEDELWDSGTQRMPAAARNGEHGWEYEWTAPIFADCRLPNGKLFENGKNYTWYVRVMNARYRDPDYSEAGNFRMNVLTNSVDYGTVNVAVRYFGPDAVKTSGPIYVQVFATPDFVGQPLGQGRVEDLADLASTAAVTKGNARIIGLKAGTYYLRAFIDTNKNGLRDAWETWAPYQLRDTTEGTMFSVKSFQLGLTTGAPELLTVTLEDCDTDHDNLPDAWEWDAEKGLDKLSVEDLDVTLTGGFSVKTNLADIATSDGAAASGMQVMRALSRPRVAALMVGVNPMGSVENVSSALAAAVSGAEIVDGTLVITDLELDAAAKTISLTVDADVVSRYLDSLASAFYTAGSVNDFRLTAKVWHKTTLLDAEWTLVATEPDVILGADGTALVIPLADAAETSGFFQVTIE